MTRVWTRSCAAWSVRKGLLFLVLKSANLYDWVVLALCSLKESWSSRIIPKIPYWIRWCESRWSQFQRRNVWSCRGNKHFSFWVSCRSGMGNFGPGKPLSVWDFLQPTQEQQVRSWFKKNNNNIWIWIWSLVIRIMEGNSYHVLRIQINIQTIPNEYPDNMLRVSEAKQSVFKKCNNIYI